MAQAARARVAVGLGRDGTTWDMVRLTTHVTSPSRSDPTRGDRATRRHARRSTAGRLESGWSGALRRVLYRVHRPDLEPALDSSLMCRCRITKLRDAISTHRTAHWAIESRMLFVPDSHCQRETAKPRGWRSKHAAPLARRRRRRLVVFHLAMATWNKIMGVIPYLGQAKLFAPDKTAVGSVSP